MALLAYKCPNCGGGLTFDPASQKFKCEYCLSEKSRRLRSRRRERGRRPTVRLPSTYARTAAPRSSRTRRRRLRFAITATIR